MQLGLTPVGQPGSFFDLTMAPGTTRTLEVDIANHGTVELGVRTYATDVYTIINGGFGGRLRDARHTGMTTWLDYADEVVALPVESPSRRTFSVRVPSTATPGEYISAIVVENDQPIQQGDAIGLAQVVRQAVAVTVPGDRLPALAIGAATHAVVAGRSVVSVAVRNTGNVRLHPAVAFTIFDASGVEVGHALMQMDTFYARTDTSVEMPLATPLAPGRYTVHLTLGAAGAGASADAAAIPFDVAAQADPPRAGPASDLLGALAGIDDSGVSTVLIVGPLAAAIVAAIGCLALVIRRRRHQAVL